MITDLLKDRGVKNIPIVNTAPKLRKEIPQKTIHTVMGNLKRWSFFCSDFKITEEDARLLLDYYNEKEGITDGEDKKN